MITLASVLRRSLKEISVRGEVTVFGQYNQSGIGVDPYSSGPVFKLRIYEKSWKRSGNEAKRNSYADAGQASACSG